MKFFYLIILSVLTSTISLASVLESTLTSAETIEFRSNGFYYTLESSPKKIHLRGHLINLSFKQKECNRALVPSLHKELKKQLQNQVTTEKHFFSVKLNGKEKKISKTSKLGKFLFNYPNIAKANKRKEAFLCRKK